DFNHFSGPMQSRMGDSLGPCSVAWVSRYFPFFSRPQIRKASSKKKKELRMTPKELIKFVKDKNIKIIDLRFVDLPGLWQHFAITVSELNEDMFEEGVGFDGSSIRGFQKIQESDMLLIPDAASAFVDPFTTVPTLDIICNVKDPVTLRSEERRVGKECGSR